MRKLLLILAFSWSAFGAANIAFTDANVRSFGGALCNGAGCTSSFSLSGSIYFSSGQDGEVDVSVNIATNTLQMTVCGTSAIPVSIDGAATVSITMPNSCGVPALKTISSTLTPGTHTIRLWAVASDTQFSSTAAFVTDGSGSVANSINGTIFGVGKTTTPFITYGALSGCARVGVSNTSGYLPDWPFAYYSVFGTPSTEIGNRYYSTGATSQSIYVYAPANTAYSLYVDGVYTAESSNILASGGGYQRVTITGLDASQHLYEWAADNVLEGAAGIIYVMPGAGGALDTRAVAPQSCGGVYGDSIAMLSNPSSGQIRAAWSEAFRAVGMSTMRYGQGGTVVGDAFSATPFVLRDNTASMFGANGVPTLVIAEGGVNDQQQFGLCANCTAAAFGGYYQTMLTNLATGMTSGGTLLAEQILPNGAVSSGQRSAYAASQATAATNYNASKVNGVTACSYSPTGWINTTTDVNGDQLHPVLSNTPSAAFPFGNPLIGYGKITNRLSFILAGHATGFGSSFTVTGPTSGAVGVASTNFTVTPAVPGAVFSGETITFGDGAGGAYVASTGDTGTGSVTVTTVVGSASFTYTYAPATAGVKTTTYSGLANCWTAPAASVYNRPPPSYILIGRK